MSHNISWCIPLQLKLQIYIDTQKYILLFEAI